MANGGGSSGMSVTRLLGINFDFQAVYMTMLGLVALYLILTHASQLNTLARTGIRGTGSWLVILQGRDPKKLGLAG